MPAARPQPHPAAWWRPALFALAAPSIALTLATASRDDSSMLLVALVLVAVVPLSIALLASMIRRGGNVAIAAATAIGVDLTIALLAGASGIGVLGIFAILPFATALALVWAQERAGPSMLGLVGFVILATTLVAPRFGLITTDFNSLRPFLAVGAALSAASTLWGAALMRAAEPAPVADVPPPPRAPRHRAPREARVAAWLTGAGLLVALSVGALPWSAPAIVLAAALVAMALPAVVALREKPPAAITLGAVALLGLAPYDGCALFDALAGTCGGLPAILGYLWALVVAGAAWVGLAAATR